LFSSFPPTFQPTPWLYKDPTASHTAQNTAQCFTPCALSFRSTTRSWIGLCRHSSLSTVFSTPDWAMATSHPPKHLRDCLLVKYKHFLALDTSGTKRQAASSSNCHREAVRQQLHKHNKIKQTVHEMIQVFGVLHWIVGLLTASAMKECTAFIFKVKTSLWNVGNRHPCHSTQCSWPESSTSILLKLQIPHTVYVFFCPLYWYLSSSFNVFCSLQYSVSNKTRSYSNDAI